MVLVTGGEGRKMVRFIISRGKFQGGKLEVQHRRKPSDIILEKLVAVGKQEEII